MNCVQATSECRFVAIQTRVMRNYLPDYTHQPPSFPSKRTPTKDRGIPE